MMQQDRLIAAAKQSGRIDKEHPIETTACIRIQQDKTNKQSSSSTIIRGIRFVTTPIPSASSDSASSSSSSAVILRLILWTQDQLIIWRRTTGADA